MISICHHYLFWKCQCGGEVGQLLRGDTNYARNKVEGKNNDAIQMRER